MWIANTRPDLVKFDSRTELTIEEHELGHKSSEKKKKKKAQHEALPPPVIEVDESLFQPDSDFLAVWNRHTKTANGRRIKPLEVDVEDKPIVDEPVELLEGKWRRRPKNPDNCRILPLLSRTMHRAVKGDDHWLENYQNVAERFVIGNWPFDTLESLKQNNAAAAAAAELSAKEKEKERKLKEAIEKADGVAATADTAKEVEINEVGKTTTPHYPSTAFVECLPFQEKTLSFGLMHGGILSQAVRTTISQAFVNDVFHRSIDHVMGRDPADDLTAEQRASLTHAFMLFDIDGGGHIDSEELEAVVHALGMNPSPAEFDQMLIEADADGTGTIDLGEFLTMMALHMAAHEGEFGEDAAAKIAETLQDAAVNMQEARALQWLADKGLDPEEDPQHLGDLFVSTWDEWLKVTCIMEAIVENDMTMLRFICERLVNGVLEGKTPSPSAPESQSLATANTAELPEACLGGHLVVSRRSRERNYTTPGVVAADLDDIDDDEVEDEDGANHEYPEAREDISLPIEERRRRIIIRLLRRRSSEGETALHYACRCGYLPIVQWLVDNGIVGDDIEALDDFGHTPRYHAELKKHHDVVKWIDEYQVRVAQEAEDGLCSANGSDEFSSSSSSRSGFLPTNERTLGRDLDLELPPSLMVSGGLNEGAMGVYTWIEEESWYKQKGKNHGRNFICRNPDSGLWVFTKSRKNVAENKGITASSTPAYLPTRTGLRWTSRRGGEWREDAMLHVVAIDDIEEAAY
jgi:hypothetical protein